ncbi:MAG: hypothetical protein ACYC36_03435 [Bellilinea sp.]
MQDRQITNILDEPSVRMFFRSLSADSEHLAIPYAQVSPFIETVKDAIFMRDREKAEKSYGKYKDNLDKLPASDIEKRTIAEYFYERGESQLFHQISSKIRDDTVKSAMAVSLVNDGDLSGVAQLTEKILSADRLAEVATRLIDLQHHDSRQLKELIDNIASKNQAELRKIAVYLLNRGEGDSELFEYIINILTSMAEMRKIASHLISDGHQRTDLFTSVFDILRSNNQRETEKVMNELFEQDRDLFNEILSKNLITNRPVLERLSQLASK